MWKDNGHKFVVVNFCVVQYHLAVTGNWNVTVKNFLFIEFNVVINYNFVH